MYKRNEVVNGYTIINKVGEGVYSNVYKCIRNNIFYAMKVYNKDNENYEYSSAARRENSVLIKLNNSPYFPKIYTMFSNNYQLHIIQEFLNKNVEKQLETKTYGISIIKNIATQLIQGLYYLNNCTHPIIHSDLKPDNIIYHNGSVKIIDFSNAVYQNEYDLDWHGITKKYITSFYTTHEIPYLQARQYRAPEIILEIGYINKIDLWSIGCILVELFTGNILFNTNNEKDHIEMIFNLNGEDKDLWKYISPNILNKYYILDNGVYYYKKTYSISPNRTLENIIYNANINNEEVSEFIKFLRCLFVLNPINRLSVDKLIHHPFIN